MQTNWQRGQSNNLACRNYRDDKGNPASGYVHGPGLCVVFQDGPRGKLDDGVTLAPANGAFVEDLLVAALQRLSHFQGTQYKCDENERAIEKIAEAIAILHDRAKGRAARGVLGQNVV